MSFATTIAVTRKDTKCDTVSAIVSRDDEGNTIVILTAWHFNDEGDEYIQEEIIAMPSFKFACGFVNDFSAASAQAFVESFNF